MLGLEIPDSESISKSFQYALPILIFFGKIEKTLSPTTPYLNSKSMRKYTLAYPSANLDVEGCGKEKEKEQDS
jgi:F420-dependent methylenetetrahydromethanopterin dehydrogenase